MKKKNKLPYHFSGKDIYSILSTIPKCSIDDFWLHIASTEEVAGLEKIIAESKEIVATNLVFLFIKTLRNFIYDIKNHQDQGRKVVLIFLQWMNQLFCDDITENNLPFAYNVTTN